MILLTSDDFKGIFKGILPKLVNPPFRGTLKMPRTTLPINDTQIKNAKPKDKNYKLIDGQGLYVLVKTNGSKLWRFNYKFDGKEQTYAIGSYPEISLLNARQKREELRAKVANDVNPSVAIPKI